MKERKFGLATVTARQTEQGLVADFAQNPFGIDLKEYSRFKYGDGNAADMLGGLLAEQFIETHDADEATLLVTSSAYKTAPPAARALQDSFVARMGELARPNAVATFKINRANLTNGDYAQMGLEERQKVMAANGLSLPEDLEVEGKDIVILDDISVTGSHESMLRKLLVPESPASIQYGYILSVTNGTEHPGIEAAINASSISTIEDVLPLVTSKKFKPNARLCKFILAQSLCDIKQFVEACDTEVVSKIEHYVTGDELVQLPRYAHTVPLLLSLCGVRLGHEPHKAVLVTRQL